MKKVISGAIIILSLGVVGCTSKEVNVTLEDYSNKVDENNNVIECIEVKTDSEKISKETVFSCRLQGKRAKKTKDIIKELVKND